MRRVFWIAVGAGVGVAISVYAVRKINETTQRYSPAGIAESLGQVAASIRDTGKEIMAAAAEREIELREALLTEPSAGNSAPGPSVKPVQPPVSRPGGWREEDADEPLYEF